MPAGADSLAAWQTRMRSARLWTVIDEWARTRACGGAACARPGLISCHPAAASGADRSGAAPSGRCRYRADDAVLRAVVQRRPDFSVEAQSRWYSNYQPPRKGSLLLEPTLFRHAQDLLKCLHV